MTRFLGMQNFNIWTLLLQGNMACFIEQGKQKNHDKIFQIYKKKTCRNILEKKIVGMYGIVRRL